MDNDLAHIPGLCQRTGSVPPYIYSPLRHEDSIRLLEISPGGKSSLLSCKLIEVHSSTAKFEALSYVWGAPVFSRWLHESESGTVIPITEHLALALQTLRCRHNQTWYLWVDAVCIDQSNIRERNHQVKSMANIFSQASQVLIWLDYEECGSAIKTVKMLDTNRSDLQNLKLRLLSRFEASSGSESRDFELANATHELQGRIRQCDVVSLSKLFAKAWFTRVWVLQEFLLAKKVAIFVGSEDVVSYRSFALAIYTLRKHEHLLPRPRPLQVSGDSFSAKFSYEEDFLRNFESVYEMCQARAARNLDPLDEQLYFREQGVLESDSSRSLYQCCRLLVNRQCTDERDKVYAALGLATNDLAIFPDYNLSFDEIRLDLTRKSLLAGDFSVLHDAETPMSDASWTAGVSFVPALRPDFFQDRPLPLGGYEARRYSAGFLRKSFAESLGSSSICIRGVTVDKVEHLDTFADALSDLAVGRGYPFKPKLLDAYKRVESLYNATSGIPGDQLSPEVNFKLAFWQTVNLGFCPEQEDTPFYGKGIDFQFLDLPYRINIKRCFDNRVFFMTQTGFIGLGPRWMKEQDTVVIFDGAETPFLLRQATVEGMEIAWKLIGDCYVEGWMDGNYFGYEVENVADTTETGDAAKQRVDITQSHVATHTNFALKSELFTLC